LRKNKKWLAILIALFFVMSFSLPALAGNPQEQGVGNGLDKVKGQLKHERNITNFKAMEKNMIKVRNMDIDSELPSVIKEGRTLIPVRAITQGLGASVEWKNEIVTVSRDDIVIKFYLDVEDEDNYGRVTVSKDGERAQDVEIDAPPGFINNRVFVPLRFIAETFGLKVSHDKNTGKINIDDEEEDEEEGTISGEVIDEEKDPIENVKVSLFIEDDEEDYTYTDEDGEYDFEDIPFGRYTIKFNHYLYQPVSRAVYVDEDVPPVNIEMEAIDDDDLFVIRGMVTDDDDKPLEDVKVSLSVMLDDKYEEYGEVDSTGDDGKYSIDVPAGTYLLEFSLDEYETKEIKVIVKNTRRVKNVTLSFDD